MELFSQIAGLAQILLIDIAMSGDNAVAVGMAASGLPMEQRRRAISIGIISAMAMRAVFAVFAVQLLHVMGLLIAGGLLLLWVAWKMYRDIRHHALATHEHVSQGTDGKPAKSFASAVTQIVVADVTMSLDNVLAVAGVARNDIIVLVLGIGFSVALMGWASGLVARLTSRYAWVAYIGLAVVIYTAFKMMWEGAHQLM